MKKSIVCLVALLTVASIPVFCQSNTTLHVNAGVSMPVAAFAVSTYEAGTPPSQAKTGFYTDAQLLCNKGGGHFKPAALLGFEINFFNLKKILDDLNQNQSNFNWEGSHGNWVTVSLMPGLYYSTNSSGKTVFYAGIYTGPAAVKIPNYTVTGKPRQAGVTGSAEGKRESKWSVTAGSRLNAGIRLKAGKRTMLELQAGINYCKPTYKEVNTTFTQRYLQPGSTAEQIAISRLQYSFTQTVITMHAGAGLVFKL